MTADSTIVEFELCPLPILQVFKHAKRLGYGEHDVSAVYIRARF